MKYLLCVSVPEHRRIHLGRGGDRRPSVCQRGATSCSRSSMSRPTPSRFSRLWWFSEIVSRWTLVVEVCLLVSATKLSVTRHLLVSDSSMFFACYTL